MYPRVEGVLELGTIAEEWARDLPQHPTTTEVLQLLLRAFWQGELAAHLGDNHDPRPRLLNALKRFQADSDLLFVDQPPVKLRTLTRHSDGSVSLSPLTLFWPDDPAARTPEVTNQAYAAAADLAFDAYPPLTQPPFWGLEIHQDAFAAFCRQRNYPLPKFWFQRQTVPSAQRAIVACKQWLREEVRRHDTHRPQSKAAYLSEAQKRFAPLSPHAFARIWADIAPSSWKRAGRPRVD